MVNWTYPIDTQHNIYANIHVYQVLRDGVLTGWRIIPHDGYVFYDTTTNFTDFDPETGEEIPVNFYYINADLPLIYNWSNFTWVAVPRTEVDENYIFGVD